MFSLEIVPLHGEDAGAGTLDLQTNPEEKSPRKRKWKCKDNPWARYKRKNLRNSGCEYISAAKKQVKADVTGEGCFCPRQCFKELTAKQRQKLFEEFWKIGSFDLQNSYHCACPVKRHYVKKKSRRQKSIVYSLKGAGGEPVIVCKRAFLSILGLQHHRGRVENIQKKLKLNEETSR